MKRFRLHWITSLAAAAIAACGSNVNGQAPPHTPRAPDELDKLVDQRMTQRRIPAMSLAVIHDGRIVDVRAYGTTQLGESTPITTSTIFQAASISKSVTALGVLRLVEKGTLSLDEDVNARLVTWKVPENANTATERVTVRRLLSHTAGLTVRGIPGHPTSAELPSLIDALSGRGNTPRVEPAVIPGSEYRYSGGGYAVLQQLVQDVTGKPFEVYMRDQVLQPLGMKNSTYSVPLPPSLAAAAPTGHTLSRTPIVGRWHDIREVAAAGLWTTPTDLAHYIIGVFDALKGRSPLLSADMARQMVTPQKSNYGYGLSIDGAGDSIRFYHGGQNHGFESYITGNPATGDGAIIMINVNDGGSFAWSILNHIAKQYSWNEYPIWVPERVSRVPFTAEVLQAIAGDYAFSSNQTWSLRNDGGHLMMYRNGLPDEEFIQAADGRFVSVDRAVFFKPITNPAGRIEAIEWTERDTPRRLTRIGGA